METLFFNLKIFWLFISIAFVIRGFIEYKVFMSFEDKEINIISRITIMISFGITNLILFYLIIFNLI